MFKPVVGIAFAAGRGSRMQPLTDTLPKPLVEIDGQTLLEHNLLACLNLVSKYLITVNWLADKIVQHMGESFTGKSIEYVFQENYNGGTLQALLDALEKIPNLSDYNYLVFNSDEIRGSEFYEAFTKKIDQNPDMALIAGKVLQDKELLKSFGVLEFDEEKYLLKVHEKTDQFVSNTINIGLYYFPGELLDTTLKPFLNSYVQITKEKYITDYFDYLASLKQMQVVNLDASYRFYTTVEDIQKTTSEF